MGKVEEIQFSVLTPHTMPADRNIDGLCFDGKKGDSISVEFELMPRNGEIKVSLLNITAFTFLGDSISINQINPTATLTYDLPMDAVYGTHVMRVGYGPIEYTTRVINQNAPATATLTADEASMPCTPGAYILVPGYASEFSINPQFITQTYCLYGQAGTEYGITVEGIQSTLDPMVIVYSDGFEAVLASNNNVAEDRMKAYTEFTAPETGLYPVVIARAGFNTGTSEGIYRLTAENITKRGPETCSVAFQIPETGLSIEAMPQNGLHTFCVDGKEGQEITLTAEAKRDTLSMTVYIIEPNWERVGTTTTTNSQKTLELTAALEEDQPYFFLVFDDSNAGGFDLTLTQK